MPLGRSAKPSPRRMRFELRLRKADRSVELADQPVDSRSIRPLIVRPPRGVLVAQRDRVKGFSPVLAERYTCGCLVGSNQLPRLLRDQFKQLGDGTCRPKDI